MILIPYHNYYYFLYYLCSKYSWFDFFEPKFDHSSYSIVFFRISYFFRAVMQFTLFVMACYNNK